ncbi:hypothetical protein HK405_005884 [Cladochytrium tenue]|nr:hypothetical protein HK405_005884 [Cladochytrium tenue]
MPAGSSMTALQPPPMIPDRGRIPRLPQIALDNVFARLWLAEASRVALVCRAWAAAARPAIFASVRLQLGLPVASEEYGALPLGSTQVARLARLSAAPSPLAFVRCLHLQSVEADAAVRFVEALAHACAKLSQLRLDFVELTADLVLALAPIAASITHLRLEIRDPAPPLAENFAELFDGQLAVLGLGAWSPITSRALLTRNRASLRILTVGVSDTMSGEVLPSFLSSGSSLHKLVLASVGSRFGPTLAEYIAAECGDTLVSLRLRLHPGFPTDIVFGGLPKLKELALDCRDDDSNVPIPLPTVWPPLTVLSLHFYAEPHLAILAFCASTIRSLDLGPANPACRVVPEEGSFIQPHGALRHALDIAKLSAFTGMRNLILRRVRYEVAPEHLDALVAYCPNLETMELLSSTARGLAPLRALARLRYLNISSISDISPDLVEDAISLATRPRAVSGGAPPAILRVFLHERGRLLVVRPSAGQVTPPAGAFRAAQAIAARSSGLVQVVEFAYQLPSYF